MAKSKFSNNKQIVRNLQLESINGFFGNMLGGLYYFGLPSEEMKDIIDWNSLFSKFVAVERGMTLNDWQTQHQLIVTAYKNEILDKLFLLRGDIDNIIIEGADDYGNAVNYPFDVVSLDYSGGLLYRDGNQEQPRLKAIKQLIKNQSEKKKHFLLFISTNLDNWQDREVVYTLENLRTELKRMGTNGDEVITAYLQHGQCEVRIKIYLPYFIGSEATYYHYNCEASEAIYYLGNQDTHMMNFRFWLRYAGRTTASRFPQERLHDIFNRSMIEIKNGKIITKDLRSLDLPKLCAKNSK